MTNRELGIMMMINHPTIIKLKGYSLIDFQGENNVVIIMEYAKNGSLFDVLKKIQEKRQPKEYTDTIRQIILIGISRGMKYLHDRNIIHRDLKPGNVLIDSSYCPHISDFGMSKNYDIGHSKSQSQNQGTLIYMAPEIINDLPYDCKVDVYAFGIIMYEVISNKFPYPEFLNGTLKLLKFMNQVANNDYRPKFDFPIKPSLKSLIESCWSSTPEKRPDFKEIFENLITNDYFISEKVDIQKVDTYVKNITKVTDRFEELIQENEKLKAILSDKVDNKTRDFKKKTIEEASEINLQIDKLIKENTILKADISKQQKNPIKQPEKKIIKNSEKQSQITIYKFNSLTLESQDSVISEIISNDEIKKDKNIFSIIKKAITFLMSLNPPKNCYFFYIFSMNDEELLSKVDTNFYLHFLGDATVFLNSKKLLNTPTFYNIITLYNHWCIEMGKYPKDLYLEVQKIHSIFPNRVEKGLCLDTIMTNENKNDFYTGYLSDFEFLRIDFHSTKHYGIGPKRATFKSSITTIYDWKFPRSLTQISIPSSVTQIGKLSFNECSSLTQISISSSVTTIKEFFFRECSSLTQITIPSSLTSIKEYSFNKCSSLTQVKFILPSSVTYIGEHAFYKCSSLTQITIPSSVTKIGNFAFSECSSLTQITFELPSSLTKIDYDAFSRCSSLTQIIIPSSVTEIGMSAFSRCSSLTQISIPYSITVIRDYTFSGCSSLTHISIPFSVVEIEYGAFRGCSSLESIIIPNDVHLISENAFNSCKSLKKIMLPRRLETKDLRKKLCIPFKTKISYY